MKSLLSVLLVAVLTFAGASAETAKQAPSKERGATMVSVLMTDAPELAAWVQYDSAGRLEARAVVRGDLCPKPLVDGEPVAAEMSVRAPANTAFPAVCVERIPSGAHTFALNNRTWVLPASDPQRILVIGDGGCRVKGIVQDCRDPDAWPFAKIAAAAAALKPDLIIHVGDYPSREKPCPAGNPVCAGQPFGDNWTVWNADLFEPMAPLLAVAPVVFTRGNHEECDRTGPGFMRLLGPYPFDAAAPCPIHQKPYAVSLGRLTLTVLDDAAADERGADPALVGVLKAELTALKSVPMPNWLILHRPIFGSVSGPLGIKVGGNLALIDALPDGGIHAGLMISGHIHSFQALNYEGGNIPPQLIAGLGGDVLADVPENPTGTIFQGHSGVGISSGATASEHGFVLMTRVGEAWRIDRFDANGSLRQTCMLETGRIACPAH